MSAGLTVMVVVVAVAVSFLLSGMEAGVFALSRFRIRRLARQGGHRAARLQRYLEHPESFLWTILIGNTVAALTVVTTVAMALRGWHSRNPAGFMGVMVGVLLVMYVFADLLPKLMFRRFPNRLCLLGVPAFRLVYLLLSPAVVATEWISTRLLKWTGGRAFTGRLFGSRAELRQAIEESAHSLSAEEVVMINRILDLQSKRVRDVMTPIGKAVALPASGTLGDLLALVRERRVSSVPLWKGEGRSRRILGVVRLSSVVFGDLSDERKPLETLVQPALFVDEDARLEAALQAMQRGRQRFAVVLGRGRHEVGVLVMNDILGSMFGEVRL